SNDNVYLGGQFRGTIDLNPGANLSVLTNGSEDSNAVYMSLDSSLDFRWGEQLDADESEVKDIAVTFIDEVETIVFGGYFEGSGDFDPEIVEFVNIQAAERTSKGGYDGFVLKTLTDGTFVDVFALGSVGDQSVDALAANGDSI